MEACILILKTKKPADRVGKILFINALDLVERKNAESKLTDEHIKQIADAYLSKTDVEGLSHLASMREIEGNDYLLSLPLYVKTNNKMNENECLESINSLAEKWNESSKELNNLFDEVLEMLEENK